MGHPRGQGKAGVHSFDMQYAERVVQLFVVIGASAPLSHPPTGETMSIPRALALYIALAWLVVALPRAAGQAVTPEVAVGPQYDSTHVYVAPQDVDSFTKSFLGTFGGTSTKQVVASVTPTLSSTTSQLLQTPVGTVSLFGYKTPIPVPFGMEQNGYLIKDMNTGVQAQAAGADLIVAPFPDAIGHRRCYLVAGRAQHATLLAY